MEVNYILLAFFAFIFFLLYKILKKSSSLHQFHSFMVKKNINDLATIIKGANDHLHQHFSSANTWQGFKDFKVIEKKVESWTVNKKGDKISDICSFVFAPVETPVPLPKFKSGQHLSFKIDPEKIRVDLAEKCTSDLTEEEILAKMNLKDWWSVFKTNKIMYYSLSDGPNPNTFRCSIKRATPPSRTPPGTPPGIGSTYFHEFVKEGDLVQTALPKGHFFIEHNKKSGVVLVAGGIGITPMVSMGKDLAERRSEREVILYYGVRNLSDLVLLDDICKMSEGLKFFMAYICISDPTYGHNSQPMVDNVSPLYEEILGKIKGNEKINLVTGFDISGHLIYDLSLSKGCRVSVSLMKHQLEPVNKVYDFYLCGPPALMKSVVTDLYHWNIPKERVHWEGFGPCAVMWPADILNSPLKPCTVTFIDRQKDEKVFMDWTPASGALMHLADNKSDSMRKIPRSCGAGFCGTCKSSFKGKIVYESEPSYKNLQKNQCLPCVGKPDGDVIVEF